LARTGQSYIIVYPTKNTRFLLDKIRIKMENPGKKENKEETPKKICLKLSQKKHSHQLPTHPQTSI